MPKKKTAIMSQPESLPLIFDDATIAAIPEADLLGLFAKIGKAVLDRSIATRPIELCDFETVVTYLRSQMAAEPVEQFRILFLNKRNGLIADEVISRGTVDHCPVYVREVAARALQHGATALILAHNHPSGNTEPSRGDVSMTKQLVDGLAPLGVTIHDHFIVGALGYSSLRGLKLM